MRYHTKRLRTIDYAYGAEGVKAYQARYPESKKILLVKNTIAYQPKPSGYNQFLCDTVDMWFHSEAALAETNRSIVGRLNEKLGTQLDPDKHFSQPVSATRLKGIAAVFDKHGSKLDSTGRLTMSGVRSQVRAAKAQRDKGAPFSKVGTIVGNTLVIGSRPFTIQQAGGRIFIREQVGRRRRRMYLEELEWFADVLISAVPTLSNYSSIKDRIGELAIPDEIANLDPLADPQIGGLAIPLETPHIEADSWTLSRHSPLAQRLASLKGFYPAAEQSAKPSHPATDDDSIDPLTL